MITPKFWGKIEGGKIHHQDADLFRDYVAMAFEEGQEVEITVKKKKKIRSSGKPWEETNFNGYYWAVCVKMVADEIGEMDQDLVHDWIQLAVGNFKVMPDGTKIAKGTGDMSPGEFAEYCSRVRMWANNPEGLGIYIPEPREAEYK